VVILVRRALPADGGHAFVIVGHDPMASWCSTLGHRWGVSGLATLTYEDWLDHAMDCWVAQLGVATEQHREVSKAVTLRMRAGDTVAAAQAFEALHARTGDKASAYHASNCRQKLGSGPN
jgi:hypothetical protein